MTNIQIAVVAPVPSRFGCFRAAIALVRRIERQFDVTSEYRWRIR